MKELSSQELRIGNFVQYGGVINKVYLISHNYFQVESTDIPTFTANKNRAAEPIPLTEEWLLRFGFHLRDGFSNTFKLNVEKHQYDCSEITYSEKEGLLRFSNGQEKGATLIPYINYVHQLQNLYFALTGEELTLKP